MEQTRIIKIFLASPGDVKDERELIFNLRDELNLIIGRPNNFIFEFVNWEKNSYPGIGEDAQDVINKNINGDYDIFIGIFWLRFGTPTSRAESGTKEEFDLALKKYKLSPDQNHIMLYFKTEPPQNIYDLNYEQFNKVKDFKEDLKKEGVLYWEFEKTNDLKNILLVHLSSLIKDKFSKVINNLPNKISENKIDKYELLAQEIDKRFEESSYEELLDLLNDTKDSMRNLPEITRKITFIVRKVSDNFNDKTKQLTIVKNIKDERFRSKKVIEISNKMAADLDNFSFELNNIIPEFSNNMSISVESYTKLIIAASSSEILQEYAKENVDEVYPDLLESIEGVLEEVAGFIKELIKIPAITSKFGESRRKAELSTNSLFKEFIKGRKVLMQIEEN